jgi:chorismate mutase
MGPMEIKNWRKKIDTIDSAMLRLLNLRAELALKVGWLKGEQCLSLRTPVREQEILLRMKKLNRGPLSSESVGKIYQVILHESLRTQKVHGCGTSGDGHRTRTNGRCRRADVV